MEPPPGTMGICSPSNKRTRVPELNIRKVISQGLLMVICGYLWLMRLRLGSGLRLFRRKEQNCN